MAENQVSVLQGIFERLHEMGIVKILSAEEYARKLAAGAFDEEYEEWDDDDQSAWEMICG